MIYKVLNAYLAHDPILKRAQIAAALDEFDPQFILTDTLALPEPGRPRQPILVSPRELKKRGLGTEQGRAALWHAIAHIEFNAINLALDAFLRFPGLPHEYYADWLRVAKEEAYHFSLINDHLKDLGFPYGAFPAHNGLWEMAEKTVHDPLVRMALVPRVMEARGLDVTPNIMQRLSLAGDPQAERILGIILRDEIGHVAVGNRWFKYLCAQQDLDPLNMFDLLAKQFIQTQLKGPYDHELRKKAGFSQEELNWLEENY